MMRNDSISGLDDFSLLLDLKSNKFNPSQEQINNTVSNIGSISNFYETDEDNKQIGFRESGNELHSSNIISIPNPKRSHLVNFLNFVEEEATTTLFDEHFFNDQSVVANRTLSSNCLDKDNIHDLIALNNNNLVSLTSPDISETLFGNSNKNKNYKKGDVTEGNFLYQRCLQPKDTIISPNTTTDIFISKKSDQNYKNALLLDINKLIPTDKSDVDETQSSLPRGSNNNLSHKLISATSQQKDSTTLIKSNNNNKNEDINNLNNPLLTINNKQDLNSFCTYFPPPPLRPNTTGPFLSSLDYFTNNNNNIYNNNYNSNNVSNNNMFLDHQQRVRSVSDNVNNKSNLSNALLLHNNNNNNNNNLSSLHFDLFNTTQSSRFSINELLAMDNDDDDIHKNIHNNNINSNSNIFQHNTLEEFENGEQNSFRVHEEINNLLNKFEQNNNNNKNNNTTTNKNDSINNNNNISTSNQVINTNESNIFIDNNQQLVNNKYRSFDCLNNLKDNKENIALFNNNNEYKLTNNNNNNNSNDKNKILFDSIIRPASTPCFISNSNSFFPTTDNYVNYRQLNNQTSDPHKNINNNNNYNKNIHNNYNSNWLVYDTPTQQQDVFYEQQQQPLMRNGMIPIDIISNRNEFIPSSTFLPNSQHIFIDQHQSQQPVMLQHHQQQQQQKYMQQQQHKLYSTNPSPPQPYRTASRASNNTNTSPTPYFTANSTEYLVSKTCRDILLDAAEQTLKAVELANTLRARVGTEVMSSIREKYGGLLALLEKHVNVFTVERIPKNDRVSLVVGGLKNDEKNVDINLLDVINKNNSNRVVFNNKNNITISTTNYSTLNNRKKESQLNSKDLPSNDDKTAVVGINTNNNNITIENNSKLETSRPSITSIQLQKDFVRNYNNNHNNNNNLKQNNTPQLNQNDQQQQQQQSFVATRCLHVGNVPSNVTELQLLNDFEKFGDIEGLKIINSSQSHLNNNNSSNNMLNNTSNTINNNTSNNNNSNNSNSNNSYANRRFAFVTFRTVEQAIAARHCLSKNSPWRNAISFAHRECLTSNNNNNNNFNFNSNNGNNRNNNNNANNNNNNNTNKNKLLDVNIDINTNVNKINNDIVHNNVAPYVNTNNYSNYSIINFENKNYNNPLSYENFDNFDSTNNNYIVHYNNEQILDSNQIITNNISNIDIISNFNNSYNNLQMKSTPSPALNIANLNSNNLNLTTATMQPSFQNTVNDNNNNKNYSNNNTNSNETSFHLNTSEILDNNNNNNVNNNNNGNNTNNSNNINNHNTNLSIPLATTTNTTTTTTTIFTANTRSFSILKRLCDDTYVPTQLWPIDKEQDEPFVEAIIAQLQQFGGATTISKLRGFLRNRISSAENTIKSVPLKSLLAAYPQYFVVQSNHVSLLSF